ncbi:MAG: hypothetical protein ACR2MY_15110 [Candidatus Dormibacteria bacterium]
MIRAQSEPGGVPSGSGRLSLGLAVLLGATAIPALGSPELASAADFLTSGRPDRAGALAAVQMIVWALVIALVLLQVTHALRRSRGLAQEVRRRRTRSRATLVLGLLIFTGGALHHQAQVGSICCGDVARADSLLR